MSALVQKRERIGRVGIVSTALRGNRAFLLKGYSPNPGSDLKRMKSLGLQEKSSFKDLVTLRDVAVEERLLKFFRKYFPGEAVFGEEQTSRTKATFGTFSAKHSSFWTLDPIDGTVNFARAYPFFCTTVSFVEMHDGCPKVVVAVTYNPLTDEMFEASLGGGAKINGKPLRVSQVKRAPEALLATGFSSQKAGNRTPFELFEKFTQKTLGVRRDGSAALDLGFVSAGRLDGYWEWGLAAWDIAAGVLLVSEAGGVVTSMSGGAVDLGRGEIVASNGFLHKWLLDGLKGPR